jgi:phosphoglycolate phosphatase-like HAD superfamily hydrolase
MLVLFDIDGTLLLTHRAGLRAMAIAGERLFGAGFGLEGVDFAGRLDPLIWADAARASGVDDPDAHHDAFRAHYATALDELFEAEALSTMLPGVGDLVAALEEQAGVTLGIVTGNYPETGRAKLAAAGLDPVRFPVSAWGSDGMGRRDLPPVAMERYEAHVGRPIDPQRVVIIGDTPHDVDCARANGCRSIAVATGPAYTIADLKEHAPDLAVDDLSATERLLDWILTSEEVGST